MPDGFDGATGQTASALYPARDTSAAPTRTPPNVGRQIVFIDGNVPDPQALVRGVQAGIEVLILDIGSNGVQQIADYLTSRNEHHLDAIQIVSHGEAATVRLGNTTLGLPNIAELKQQLATIGRALKPGGGLFLTLEEVDDTDVEEAFRSLTADGQPAVRGEIIEGDVAGYHYYPGRHQALAWLTDAGFTLLDEDVDDHGDWAYRLFLLRRT